MGHWCQHHGRLASQDTEVSRQERKHPTEFLSGPLSTSLAHSLHTAFALRQTLPMLQTIPNLVTLGQGPKLVKIGQTLIEASQKNVNLGPKLVARQDSGEFGQICDFDTTLVELEPSWTKS